jgi:hypothetical protein
MIIQSCRLNPQPDRDGPGRATFQDELGIIGHSSLERRGDIEDSLYPDTLARLQCSGGWLELDGGSGQLLPPGIDPGFGSERDLGLAGPVILHQEANHARLGKSGLHLDVCGG